MADQTPDRSIADDVPFNLHVAPIQNTDELLHDASVKSLIKRESLVVFPHDQIDAMLDKDLLQKLDSGKHLDPADYQKMSSALARNHPEISERFESNLADQAQTQNLSPEKIDNKRKEFLSNLFGPRQSITTQIPGHNFLGIGQQDLNLIKMQDAQAKEHLYKDAVEGKLGEGQTPNTPPGTDKEWTAIIDRHELTHTDHNFQQPLTQYFNQHSPVDNPLVKPLGQAKEAEADMASITALNGKLSPGTADYYIAERINRASPSHFNQGIEKAQWFPGDKPATPDWQEIMDPHEVGFIDAVRRNTGQTPNDQQTINTAVSGFYQKSGQLYLNQFEAKVKDKGFSIHNPKDGAGWDPTTEIGKNSGDLPTTPDIMVQVVQQGLDKGIYKTDDKNNIDERKVAQQYLNSMQVLGVKPTIPLDKQLDKAADKAFHQDNSLGKQSSAIPVSGVVIPSLETKSHTIELLDQNHNPTGQVDSSIFNGQSFVANNVNQHGQATNTVSLLDQGNGEIYHVHANDVRNLPPLIAAGTKSGMDAASAPQFPIAPPDRQYSVPVPTTPAFT